MNVEEQFHIQGTLLDDITFQTAQLLKLEQYCSQLVSGCRINVWVPYLYILTIPIQGLYISRLNSG